MKNKINRKDFLKAIIYLMLLPLLWVLNRMFKDHQRFWVRQKEIRLKNNLPQGFSISDEVILHKSENQLNIYSSKCTHLGCKINRVDGEELVCPCHGSRYNSLGEPIKGPSLKALKKLDYSIENNEIVIRL